MRFFYDLAFSVFAVSYFPFFLKRLKEEKEKKRLLRERMGIFSPEFLGRVKSARTVWIHAVSVGEVYAVKPLVEELNRCLPGRLVVISTVTPTGQATAKKFFPGNPVFYFPFDISVIVGRVLGALSPELILLAETELWPNLITEAARRGIPVGIVNGRLSPRSYSRYRLIRPLMKGLLGKIAFLLVQFPGDAERFVSLGAPSDRVTDTGNMKFDFIGEEADPRMRAWGERLKAAGRRLIVAGSTHPGEDELLLDVFRRLRPENPKLCLVLAPRHIRRSDEIEIAAGRAGVSSQRISVLKEIPGEMPDVLILDVLGELKNWYSVADAAVVGGSFIRHGGHNPIEAAIFRKPIISGPCVFNFQAVYEKFLEKQAVLIAKDGGELCGNLAKILKDENFAKALGIAAFQVVKSLQGVTRKNAEYVEKFLRERPRNSPEGGKPWRA
ncbi:MAG TPA: 3-deoxy-D-manno-octulosonic acid transferase [Candidatus Omnitrophota bacterium]|nr:3-deoxy-D-manno-octulosonic acid transferase [Candidatus Omnitrophota bacterium]